jgi:hypothetical protein
LCCEERSEKQMNLKTALMNTLAYIIYLLITYLVTVHVGLAFYRNGRAYILNLLLGDEALTDSINRILLTGYYLLNLGYAAVMISFWKTIETYAELIASIGIMTGRISHYTRHYSLF